MRRTLLAFLLAAACCAQTEAPKDLDLFLLIGQSNMAGRGVVGEAETRPSQGVWMLTEKMQWAPAVDPLHFDKPTIAGVGLGRSFAETLLRLAPGRSIGLIPAAFGGSALNEWTPEGKHYPNAVARAKEAMKSGKLRGILWHQGEADSKPELAATYRERFAKFIAQLRNDLGEGDTPVVVGQLGEFFHPDSEGVKKVNEQLATIPLLVPKSAFVSSAGLVHKGDSVHFDTPSLKEFGRRYALAYLSLDPGWGSAGAAAAPAAPDRKAHSAAMAITDPAKKIEALEKFKADFPESSLADGVDDAIFQTLVRKLPDQKKRIMRMAAERYKSASAAEAGRVASAIAVEFVDAGVFLKEAEEYAKKSIKPLDEAAYIAEQRARAEKRKQTPPSDEESRKKFKEMRAGRIGALGRVYAARGDKRGKALLEEAWADNSTLTPIAVALGDLSLKAGEDQKALDYLVAARLSGRAPAAAMANFETAYRKLHKGSFDGAEDLLDREYRKRFPNPVHVEPYRGAAKRSDRVVLTEVFTGAGCPPCTAADLAIDGVLERYARKDVAVVMYHQHIPRPDPMANENSDARRLFYGIRGVPTIGIDGKTRMGGGPRTEAPEQFQKLDAEIRAALEKPAEAKLEARARMSSGAIAVEAAVTGVKVAGKPRWSAVAVLVEKELHYSGENGVRFHPMVARAVRSVPVGGDGARVNVSFDLAKIAADNKKQLDDVEKKRGDYRFSVKKHEIDPAHLAVVLFVEDPAAHKVMQAAYVEVER
jgi:glutaredoxin